MTREEEINKASKAWNGGSASALENLHNHSAAFRGITNDEALVGFVNGCLWADEHPKAVWNSTKKKMPKDGEDVIAITPDYGVMVVKYSKKWVDNKTEGDYFYTGLITVYSAKDIEYWCSIPPLPTKV